ncbi:ATP-binding protein [Neobacillus drentensis]|uniref:ATP-binding protein n=1 Tax=Neobacillus drentensis TaxID=220684 RepID=UPI002FFDD676
MRDIVTIPFNSEESLIIACDNSGGIGMKEQDHVHVPYEMVAYYAFRVAVMECIAAGGEPISVVLHNFCGNEPWNKLVSGIEKGLSELMLSDVRITGSTESNFQLLQSAIGVVVLGKKSYAKITDFALANHLNLAVIGLPLVGNEVIELKDQIAPLSIFQKVSLIKGAMLWPVGSRGILYELNQMFPNEKITQERVVTTVDIMKSAGPSTCFMVYFQPDQEEILRKITGDLFHNVEIKK